LLIRFPFQPCQLLSKEKKSKKESNRPVQANARGKKKLDLMGRALPGSPVHSKFFLTAFARGLGLH